MNDVADTPQGLEFSQTFIGPIPVPGLTVAGINGIEFDDRDFRWSGQIGYRFNRFIDIEIGYADLGSVESGVSLGGANTGLATLDIS